MEKYSPIILFVYNRPELTVKTINALKENHLAKYSDLFIYSDSNKSEDDRENVQKVREIIKGIEGFKSVKITQSTTNKGLANSVIGGVTEIIKKYGTVIVLEDDLVTSPHFLSYMNSALKFYNNKSDIWSISGYNPISGGDIRKYKDVYFTGRASSWGWATWENKWLSNNWNVEFETLDIFYDKTKQKAFNEYGNDLFPMLKDQRDKHINSWAIRWCFNQFLDASYTVYPIETLVKNLGLSGESTHGSFKSIQIQLTDKKEFKFSDIYIDSLINKRFKAYYDLKLYNYIGFFLKKLGVYRIVKSRVKQIYNLLGGKK